MINFKLYYNRKKQKKKNINKKQKQNKHIYRQYQDQESIYELSMTPVSFSLNNFLVLAFYIESSIEFQHLTAILYQIFYNQSQVWVRYKLVQMLIQCYNDVNDVLERRKISRIIIKHKQSSMKNNICFIEELTMFNIDNVQINYIKTLCFSKT